MRGKTDASSVRLPLGLLISCEGSGNFFQRYISLFSYETLCLCRIPNDGAYATAA